MSRAAGPGLSFSLPFLGPGIACILGLFPLHSCRMAARSFQGWIILELWPMGRGTFPFLTSKKAPKWDLAGPCALCPESTRWDSLG